MQSPVHQRHVHHKILHLWPGEACWWTIHPASKQRSEGEKVRVGDDLILVSVSSERYLVSHYLGLSIGMALSLFSACMIIAIKQSWFDFFFLLTACFFFSHQQNVSAPSLWVFLCLPLLCSCLSSTCPTGMTACMWTQHSSRPSGVWPPSAREARLHKVGSWLTLFKSSFPNNLQYTVHFKSQKGRLVSWWCMSQVSHTSLFWQNINVVALLIEVSWRLSLNCIFGTLKCDIL